MNEAQRLAADLIRAFEGCEKRRADGLIYPYICPAGYPTQGWGIVVPSLAVPAISQDMADSILAREVPRYMADALKASPGLARYPRRLAAITSFVFNLGAARYRSSTLRRLIDAQEWAAAAAELPKWCRGGGRVLKGLVLRREAERRLFESEA